MFKKYFSSTNLYLVLAIIVVAEMVFTYFIGQFTLNEQVLYNSFGNELSLEEIKRFTTSSRTNTLTAILSSGAKVLLEVLIISIFVMIGVILLRFETTFKQVLNATVKSYIIFSIIRLGLIVVYSMTDIKTYDDLDYLPKISLYPLFDASTLPEWAVFPLQTVNLMQLAFIALLAWGLQLARAKGYGKWLALVAGTYGVMLAIEISLVIFWLYT